MPTVPRFTTHSPGFVELVIRNSPDVAAYRVSAANTLDDAFTSPTSMVTVARGASYKSRSLRRKRLGTSVYETRGLTVLQYDPEDFWVPAGNLPHDADTAFVVVEEQNSAGAFRPPGPILIVPPPGFFSTTRPALIVKGTAPNVAASATGVPPDGALRFVLPRFADSTTIVNNGGASIFVAFGPASTEVEILQGQYTLLPDGAVSEILIRGSGASVPFSIFFAVVNAEMA
jgi:hypothetical protein